MENKEGSGEIGIGGFQEYFEDLSRKRVTPLGLIGVEGRFAEAEEVWRAGGNHLNSRGGMNFYWFRNNNPLPHKGHLLFRYRNRIFSVFVDTEFFPFSDSFLRGSFLEFADAIDAIPAVLRMERRNGSYVPSLPGWGLIHAVSGAPVDPLDMATNDLIEMSNVELHHQAVSCAKEMLMSSGEGLLSMNSFSDFEPSLVVQKNNVGRWVLVRAFRIEELGTARDIEALQRALQKIPPPEEMTSIREACEGIITNVTDGSKAPAPGLFVTIGFGGVDYLMDETTDAKLYRGVPMIGMVVIRNLDGTDYIEPSVAMFKK